MGIVDTLVKTAISGRASTAYKVGGKPSGIPFDVKLSLDQDFKKTVIKGVTIFTGGVCLGIAAGIIISNSKKKH
jgi:hypothetical protein